MVSNNIGDNIFPTPSTDNRVNSRPSITTGPILNDNNIKETYLDFFSQASSASPWGINRGINLELLSTEAMEKIYYNALQNGGQLSSQDYFDLAKHQKLAAWASELKNTDAANREWKISGLNDGLASSG
ncbi:MAG: hypothetical protein EBR67_03735 [Proteobacteria bacterium]|nr:hypothetical protein [Pseudomonadota bacterium]